MEKLKQLLALEAKYQLKDSVFDELLSGGFIVRLRKYEPLIDAGEYCPDIFIVKEGVIRGTYLQKNVEVTTGFALPGTLLCSFHCYYGDAPSFLRFEACCPSSVVKIPMKHFDALVNSCHEFAIWVMSANQNQLYYNEQRINLLSGDAQSRLRLLLERLSKSILAKRDTTDSRMSHQTKVQNEIIERWKEIFSMVPSKVIASYLGVTEQHLSKVKRNILYDLKSGSEKYQPS